MAAAGVPVAKRHMGGQVANIVPLRGKSFMYFPENSPFRRRIYSFVSHRFTTRFILICIVVNTVMLALQGPTGEWLPPEIFLMFFILDLVLTVIYSLEMFFWMIGLGVVRGEGAYLQNSWFRLDFVVVVTAWLSFLSIPGLAFSFRGFRVLRALRPLRALKFFGGIRAILESLKQSGALLVDVVVFLLFLLVFFGITGIQLFGSSLRRRCFMNATVSGQSRLQFPALQGQIAQPEQYCGGVDPYGSPKGFQCPPGQICLHNASNPNYGYTSFDHIGVALLTIFASVSLEGWADVMYAMQDAEYSFSWLYFIPLIIVVSFFVLNLFVAVISASFARVRENERRSAFAFDADEVQAVIVPTSKGWILRPKVTEEDSDLPWYRRYDGKILPKFMVKRLFKLITMPQFEIVVLFAIFVNAIFLSLEYDGASDDHKAMLVVAEYVFTGFFVMEMLLKFGGRGILGYFRDPMNRFDFVVVVLVVVSLFVDLDNYASLRVGRLLRLARILTRWPRLKKLIDSVLGSLVAIANLMAFMAFSLLVFGILGMQLFGGRFGEMGPNPRINFDNFLYSILTLFIVMTGENWTSVMFDGIRVKGEGWFAVAFFVVFFVWANYILLNLFIAVILENFELKEREKIRRQIEAYERSRQSDEPDDPWQMRLIRFYQKWEAHRSAEARNLRVPTLPPDYVPHVQRRTVERYIAMASGAKAAAPLPGSPTRPEPAPDDSPAPPPALERVATGMSLYSTASGARDRTLFYKATVGRAARLRQQQDDTPQAPTVQDVAARADDALAAIGETIMGADDGKKPDDEEPAVAWAPEPGAPRTVADVLIHRYTVAIGCLQTDTPLRVHCARVVKSRIFDAVIMVVILLSSVFLLLEFPNARRDPLFLAIFTTADLVFLIVFSVEFLIKVCAKGFLFTQTAYLRDGWNGLDFVVLVTSAAAYFVVGGGATLIKSLRAARSLRPLRVINLSKGMRVIVDSLLVSLPQIFNVVLMWLFFLFAFGILGVNLFSGKFYHCTDPAAAGKADCVGYFVDSRGVPLPRVWENPSANFDNIVNSVITLFEVGSLEGWIEIMHAGMDVTDKNVQPKQNNSPLNVLFFVSFIFLGSFFIVKLFVGVIIDSFNQHNGSTLLTTEQRQWVDMKRVMVGTRPMKRPPRPAGAFRGMLYDLVRHPWFEKAVTATILLNMMFMATEFVTMPDAYALVLEGLNWFFVGVFSFEMAVKLIGLGVKGYLSSGWNIFDGSVVLGSIIFALIPNFFLSTAFIRAVRSGRIVRIIRQAKGLRTLFNTLVTSLPSIGNLTSLLVLLMFIYSVVGIQIFGTTKFGLMTNRHANFHSIGNAALLLFRMITGENWNAIMHDHRVTSPNCVLAIEDALSNDDCGWPLFAPAFFISFYLFGSYVALNLFIAVILENFSYCLNKEENILSEAVMLRYQLVWLEFDPKGNGYLPLFKLREFLEYLGPPLGFDTHVQRHDFHSLYREARFLAKVSSRGIAFRHLLQMLTLRKVGLKSLDYIDRVKRVQVLRDYDTDVAANKICATIRGFLTRRAIKELLAGSEMSDASRRLRQSIVTQRVASALRVSADAAALRRAGTPTPAPDSTPTPPPSATPGGGTPTRGGMRRGRTLRGLASMIRDGTPVARGRTGVRREYTMVAGVSLDDLLVNQNE